MHTCWACLMLERAKVRVDSDRAGGSPALGEFSRVCEPRTADRHDRAFFTPLSYPSKDFMWRHGFLLIQFTAKSELNLCRRPRLIKQFHNPHPKVKDKVHSITGHESPQVEYRYSSTVSLTSTLYGVGSQRHAPTALLLGKTRYSLFGRLGGSQGRSGQVLKISPPPGFDPRTVQHVVGCCAD